MPNAVSSTLAPSNRNSPINQLDYAIQSRLYDINTMLPCEVMAVRTSSDGTNLYDVQSLLNPRDPKGQPAVDANGIPIPRSIMTNVTAGIIAGGVSAIIVPYAVGDKVWVSFCQRDITNSVGAKFRPVTPASARSLSLCDGVIKCHIDNLSPTTYTTVIKFAPDGTLSITTTSDKDLNITSGKDINVNVTGKAVVTATEVDINSGNINLGEGGVGILNGNTQFQVIAQSGSDVLPVTIVPGTISTTVKATS